MASGIQKNNVMIVDPDLDTRMRLRQAMVAVPDFGLVRQCGALREALGHLQNDPTGCDVVFISHRFQEDSEVREFIKQLKETPSSQDAAFVLVLQEQPEQTAEFATQVATGFDSFLVEPYSVNSLVEITKLANKVKKERGESRARIAVNLLAANMIDQLDMVAYLKSSGYEVGRSMSKLKDMAATMRQFCEDYSEVCSETLIKLFSEAPLPKKIFQVKKYSGVSDRVKKRMEQKIISQMEAIQSTGEKKPKE